MAVFCIEIHPRPHGDRPPDDPRLRRQLQDAGLPAAERAWVVRLFFLEGAISRAQAHRLAADLLVDPLTETFCVRGPEDPWQPPDGACTVEVHLRPGVMDPVAESTLAELRAEGAPVEAVRTARRYVVAGAVDPTALVQAVRENLSNDCIEQVFAGTAGVTTAPRPPEYEFKIRRIAIRQLSEAELEALSRRAHLFLSREEMVAIREHFRALDRDPTDLELETLAQTWSEHCVHKTLKSQFIYRGAPLPPEPAGCGPTERRYGNLLDETIGRATRQVLAAGRGPQCLSVFQDNAGVIAFDEDYGIAFKVETHNHPSAIEPYGGAATGTGGCIRDIIGCGLGAKPIANTDVFCVAPTDWPVEALPQGVLHPARLLRQIVQGVADYGNRMGIPTVNGAISFDPRYLGNPLVYCGCVGLIPRDRLNKAARAGDLIVLIGGRTGRDGIHGATFSSAELTQRHADEFAHAVQIGNPITQKRVLDGVLRARDDTHGCLYTAITDCGAGGLSSAVGEMGRAAGATVDLEKVPLKYAGLRYDEIWISEAQERMVLAVPPDKLPRLFEVMQEEEVEATVIGTFGCADRDGRPKLRVRYEGHEVGLLDMEFLHGGLPRRVCSAEWWPPDADSAAATESSTFADPVAELLARLAQPNVAAKEWVIRQYDHEVQGATVIKPLVGPGQGPADAAVLQPRPDSRRAIAVGCGLAPHLSDIDPYWMAAAAIDEALRNVVCVGGDPRQTAILDNFCWGRTDDPHQLGALVRACQACYDLAIAYGLPFISGKDSLNNEFALAESDIEPLLAELRRRAARTDHDGLRLRRTLSRLESRLRKKRRLSIPGTLLISAVSIVPDLSRCVSPDLKGAGHTLLLVGGLPVTGYDLAYAARIHQAVADAVAERLVLACHDCSEGGWLVALAEMAIAGLRGVTVTELDAVGLPRFQELCAAYVIEAAELSAVRKHFEQRGVSLWEAGVVRSDSLVAIEGRKLTVNDLRAAWTHQGAP